MSSALANPDFAIICAFFDRFGDLCGLEKQDTKQLIEWLQNTDDVNPELADLHMKLMRKVRKTVHATKWEKALIKFAYVSTSMQDAWEIERFGYKKASIAVKLRVLKTLLEFQFDANVKFKNAINLAAANDLRGTPIGKDEYGNAYWYFLDDKCNIFIYQENSDDETWRLVASTREEFVQLIQRLKDRVPIAPPADDIIDEEDSSNSQPAISLDETPKVEEEVKEEEVEEEISKVASLKITLTNPDKDGVSEIVNKNEGDENEIKQEVTSHSDSPLKITITTKGRKGTPKKLNNVVESVPEEVPVKQEETKEVVKEETPEPEVPIKKGRGRGRKATPVKTPPKAAPVTKKQESPAAKNPPKRGGAARGGKRARRSGRNTRNHKTSDSDEVGSEIEEETLHVRGEGSGAENETAVPFECSEEIEESTMYFHGEGSGYESLVGNPEPNDANKEQAKTTPVVKQSFFFGSPGCLKNRPMTFGSSSLFSFGGQTTFGASSSSNFSPKPAKEEKKTEEKAKEIDEVDKSNSVEKINLTPCKSFTSLKSIESLPVTKLGNTKNFEDIIDDDSSESKATETEDSGCPSSENNVTSKVESIPTPDEAPSISENNEISYTPPLTPPGLPSDAAVNDKKLEESTVNNESVASTSQQNSTSCETKTSNSSELKSESNISDIPLPEEISESSEHKETNNIGDSATVNETSKVINDDSQKEVSSENSQSNDIQETLSDIPLPDEEKPVVSIESPEEVSTQSETPVEDIPLPAETNAVVEETSDRDEVEVAATEKTEILTEDIPLPEECTEDAEKTSEETEDLENKNVNEISSKTLADVKDETTVNSSEKSEEYESVNKINDTSSVSKDQDESTNVEKTKPISLVPYESEDSSMASASEIDVPEVQETVEEKIKKDEIKTSDSKVEEILENKSEKVSNEQLNETTESSVNENQSEEQPETSASNVATVNESKEPEVASVHDSLSTNLEESQQLASKEVLETVAATDDLKDDEPEEIDTNLENESTQNNSEITSSVPVETISCESSNEVPETKNEKLPKSEEIANSNNEQFELPKEDLQASAVDVPSNSISETADKTTASVIEKEEESIEKVNDSVTEDTTTLVTESEEIIETPKNVLDISNELPTKSDSSSSQALHIVESDEKSNVSHETTKVDLDVQNEQREEKPQEPEVVEYQQKKKRARTESGSLKERILFRPQIDFIQNDVQPYTSTNTEVQIQEQQEKADQCKLDIQPEKSSAEHSNVSSIEEQDASRGSRESNLATQQTHQQRPFIPFEESQNANDAMYASSTESSKTDAIDESISSQKYVSKREKAMQRTTFNDFSVSKLIGSNRETVKESKVENLDSLANEKTFEAPVTTVHNVELQSTSSPVKHSIENMMAKSPRSSPSPQSDQSVPLDLQKHLVPVESVTPEAIETPVESVSVETKQPRGRGRRKASNDFDLGSLEQKTPVEVDSPPSKKPQTEATVEPPVEESTVRNRRGRKKTTPIRLETPATKPINEKPQVAPETCEQSNVIESKRPRKSVSPEKIVKPPVEPEIITPEKIAPKLRAKLIAKKSISLESPEKPETEPSPTKSEKEQEVEVPKEKEKKPEVDESVGRSTRTRQKRAANEPLVETQIAKELKTEKSSPAKARGRKRRMSEEESRKRQSSESDNDVFDQAVEPSACSESSEEDFIAPAGGKRAKMRGKQIDASLRKEVESKKQQEIPTTSDASEDDPAPRTRGGRQTRRSGGQTTVSTPPEKKKAETTVLTPPEKKKAETTVSIPPEKKKADTSVSTPPDKKKAETTPPKAEKVEEKEEQKPDRRGKAKRRNEATNKPQVNDSASDVKNAEESSHNEEAVEKVESKIPDEQSPINSPDSKKAKIETSPEKPAEPETEPEPEAQQEPKKRGGRPRKTTTTTPTTTPQTTPKKPINAVSSEIDQSNVIQTIDNDAPVRQSRRIAQAKIREEADRRKMEEVMLAQLKADNDKKKRAEAKDKDFVPKGYKDTSDSDNDDSNASGSRKRGPKKRKDKKNWKTSDESSSDEAEVEEEEEQHSEPDVRHAALKSDHEFSCESEDEDALAVPTKRARTVKKEDQSDSDDDNPEHACQKCHKTDHPEWILLCDTCDKGYHCSCLKPVLFLIPEGDWFCPQCQHTKLIETLEQKLLDYDFLIRQHELAEIHRQREEKIAAEKEEAKRVERERCDAERKIEEENARLKKGNSSSNSSGGSSGTDSDDDKPLYKLRRRNQAPVTYRFNDYDDMINRAIRKDMEEVEEANQGSGNAGRGKDISTIIEADKEEKRRQSMALDENDPKPLDKEPGETSESESDKKSKKSDDDDDEPIRRSSKKSKKNRKKPRRKLNQLDLSSDEDDPTDESFKGSSDSSDEVENFGSSSGETESSLELAAYRRKANKERKYATRRRREPRIQTFINDNDSGDESDVKPTRKKKKKSDSEEFELSDDSEEGSGGSEDSEDVDSEELCDDSDSESNSEYRWSKSKKKKRESSGVPTQAAGKQPRKGFGKKRSGKKVEDEDKAFRAGISKKKVLSEKKKNESDDSDDSDTPIRKTRGRQMHYLEDDFESSDEGIKPGVFRPDTPPEEREAFIRKQEEIKRMLAEKNSEAAKALAIPSISGKPEVKIDAPTDNISIIPASVIENAKALDSDYHKIKPGQSVFDDLPDDFNPDEMDDEELEKMMEEEDFANHQLKLAGDLKQRKLKDGESPSKKPLIDPSVLPTNLVKLPKQIEKKLKKKKEEDVEPPTSVVQAPIANIPTEAEAKRREAIPKPHMPLHPNAPPNVTISSPGQLPGKLSPHSMHQQHGPIPHPYQGPPRFPPGSLPPHLYAQMRPGIQPHPGMPGFGGPPPHLASMYQQNIRNAGMPSNLNPALRSLMNMPPNLPPSPHQRLHGSPSLMNPLMAMSQIPAGGGPSPMNRNVPPLHKDLPPSSVIATPPHIQPPQPTPPPPAAAAAAPKEPAVEHSSPVKKRGRRKKITPLRDDLPKNDPTQSIMQMKPEFKTQVPPTDPAKLSVVGQPQLFSLTQSAPASVITRVIPQSPALANISKSSPGSLPQPPPLYSKSPPHPSRSSGAGASQSSAPPKSSPHLPSEPGRLSALHSQPPYRHPPSGVIYHGAPPGARVYHDPMPIHHRIHHSGPPGTPPSAGSRSPSGRPGVYPGQYPPHHLPPHQFPPYPFPGAPPTGENRSPAHSTPPAGSPYPPPGPRTPQTFVNDEDRPRSGSAGAGSAGNNSNSGGAGEFSGLVSYFSSQHDDLS